MSKEYIHFNLPLDVKTEEGKPTKLVGYAAVFDQLSEDLGGYRARIRKGAFDKALAGDTEIFALMDHDDSKPIAVKSAGTLNLSIDDKGVYVEITPVDSTNGRDAIAEVQAKLKKGMSIGFAERNSKTKWTLENGTKIRDHYSIDKLDEVSVVTQPAFSQTSILATFSLEQKKEQQPKPQNTNKSQSMEIKVMSMSWTDIKKLEENRSVQFSKAQAMKDRDLNDEETAELDRLCSEVDQLDNQINEAKTQYFGRNVARKSVVTHEPISQKSFATSVGFKPKELQRYSLMRAISKRINGQPLDGIEAEVNEEMIKFTGKAPQGFYFPMELQMGDRRYDLDTTAGTGAVNESVLTSSFIELLRARTIVDRLGATYLTNLVGNISIPKQTAGATAYWVAESNAPTESNQTIGQVALAPKTVGAFTDISRKMILQTSLSAEAFVRNDLATTLALAIDYAAFNGTGASNQPTGILNASGVSETASAGDEFADVVDLESRVEEAEALNGNLAYVMRPGIKALYKTVPTVTNGSRMVWENNQVNGYPAFSSTQITNNQGDYGNKTPVIFGNWADLVLGFWGALDILVDPYTASSSGTVRIRALQDCDIVLRHAESFACKYYD